MSVLQTVFLQEKDNITDHRVGREGVVLISASQQKYSIFLEYQGLNSSFVLATEGVGINLNVLKSRHIKYIREYVPGHLQL